jgi:PAS domain S-box-containing protein
MSLYELEANFAALTGEVDSLASELAGPSTAHGKLATIRQGIESLRTQIFADDRIEQAERDLQESEGYNKVLLQESHRPFVVFDPEAQCFIDSNRAAAEIFGYSSREDVIGKTPLDMAAPTQYDGTDSATASRRRDRSARTQGIESFEWRHQRPNGEIWDGMVHLMAFDYRGRLLQATLDDITERKKTEEALRQSRQLLESVLEHSPAVIYAKRKDGKYTYINREWETVCNLPRGKVLGRTDHDLFPTEIAEQFRSNDLAVLLTGKLAESEEWVGTPWGEQLFLSKKVPLTSADGQVEGLCGISTNITDQKRNESTLRETIMTLERERENKLMSVDAIMASIAHEVRQPLAAIASNASAALRFSEKTPPDHDEVRAALKRIIADNRRADELFDSIPALFRRSGQTREPLDVNEVANEAVQSLRAKLREHEVETDTVFASGLPSVDGNRSQLQEVIVNLVHNAIEAMDATTDQRRIVRVRTEVRGGDVIVVAVEDSGPGFDPTQVDRIFDAFVTTKARGMGLGLAICRKIIESHGGQLSATSDGKNGARFQFVLPIASESIASGK